MGAEANSRGVVLAEAANGTQVLHELLRDALVEYPETFPELALPPDPASLKARYAELLPEFEAARVQSPQRTEIARFLALSAAAHLRYVDERGERTLAELFSEPHAPLPLLKVELQGPRRLTPHVELGGRFFFGEELASLASELDRARLVTTAAARALSFVAEEAASPAGLSLSGERFVLFGAGAELSPVYALLEAGAEVLWLDPVRPPIDHLLEPRLGGAVYYPDSGADLLADPGAVRATILEFAQRGPVHLGLYAWASGATNGLRLTLVMNEIVRSLPPGVAKSVSYLLSPAAPSLISPEDAEQADERQKSEPTGWRALLRKGVLQRGYLPAGDERISRAVVSQQGATFQLAEYVGKRLAAEALLEFGSALRERSPGSLAVFADMAPLTASRSLSRPLLAAAIVGAPSFDILIAQPASARAIAALLAVHDVLNPELEPPVLAVRSRKERARALFGRQFHGGVHAQPYALQGIVRVAALKGFAHRPKLALELFR